MRISPKNSLLALALAAGFLAVSPARAQFLNGTISVDFNSNNGGNGTDASAGQNAVVTPGTWNEIVAGNTGGPIALNLSTGAASNVTLSYTATGSYDVIPFMSPTQIANSPNLGLLRDFIDNTSTTVPQTVTLSGLSLGTTYTLYLYVGGNVNGRQTIFTVGATTLTATFADADTTFVNGHNYVAFTGLSADAAGTITVSYLAGATNEGDFNGLQLVALTAVPEPSGLALLGLGGAALAGVAARRRRHTRA